MTFKNFCSNVPLASVYFYEYLCKLKDMRKVFEKNFLSDNTIVQETNGVIVFNM